MAAPPARRHPRRPRLDQAPRPGSSTENSAPPNHDAPISIRAAEPAHDLGDQREPDPPTDPVGPRLGRPAAGEDLARAARPPDRGRSRRPAAAAVVRQIAEHLDLAVTLRPHRSRPWRCRRGCPTRVTRSCGSNACSATVDAVDHGQLDPALGGLGGLAEQHGRQHRVVDRGDHLVGQPLGQLELPGRELHGGLGPRPARSATPPSAAGWPPRGSGPAASRPDCAPSPARRRRPADRCGRAA